jgi:Raf kinase inhibitor-like YbhB/YbcL family protein
MKKGLIIFLIIVCSSIAFWFAQKNNLFYNSNMQITSSQFKNGGEIPSLYTCDGSGFNPPLIFKDVPKDAKSLALIVDDPDAPSGTWDHWVMWNILPNTKEITENGTPMGAITGKNSWPANKYGAPCPPNGSHRYYFKLYALDIMLNLPLNSNSSDLQEAIKGHTLAEAELMGRYQKK